MRIAAGLLFLALAGVSAGAALPKNFAHPDRIRYDRECFTIDGKDTFIFSGSFHYFRCPKPLWRDRFRAIKAAGCNAVETYVPWNWYERKPPASLDDYSQDDFSDLKEWLRMAQDEFGLYTIVRPGPYICAEWDGGGFPRWLLAKKPAGAGAVWLRGDDPVFLAWSEHWMKAVCPAIAAEQLTRKAPGKRGVILVQIENEYDLYKAVPEAERVPHLKALYETALGCGIEVPIFTCWTRQCRDSEDPELSQVFDAVNSYPRFKIGATADKIHAAQAQQPDTPVMVSELQGGWFSKVGGQLSEDQPGMTAGQITSDTLLAIQEGATVLNYYMMFGGTNFGLWGARGMTTTYDYDAPIREPGGVGEKYLAVQSIGRMLQRHGAELVRSHAIQSQAEIPDLDITVAARRGRDGGTFIFFRNGSTNTPHRGAAVVWVEKSGDLQINYDLAAFESNVFFLPPKATDPASGEWLLKLGPGPRRPAEVPAAERPGEAQIRRDPGFADWVSVPAGALLPELGVFDSRPVVYSAEIELSDSERAKIDTMRLEVPKGEGLAVAVNGRVLSIGEAREASVGPWLRTGENKIEVLYVQAGQANTGKGIEEEAGLRSAKLGRAGAEFDPVRSVTDWRLGRSPGGLAAGWPAFAGGEAAGWSKVDLDQSETVPEKGSVETAEGPGDSLAAWYRVEFEVPVGPSGTWIPWRAKVDASGDGLIYLNGQALGRFWGLGPQREFYLPECWLKFGPGKKNVLTFCLSPIRGRAGLRAVEIAPYSDQAEVR